MNPIVKVAKTLDQKEFFNFRLWEFCLRNTMRLFPWYFLFGVLLRHPFKAVRGFFEYRTLVRKSPGKPLHGNITISEILRLLQLENNKQQRFILAPGFCMKPYNEVKHKSLCPAGFFNHRCLILDKSLQLQQEQEKWPEPCNRYNIGTLARLSAGLKADFYIMTSALDIAHDLFLPAMKGTGASLGLFLLCPYSAEAFTFGVTSTGIKGTLITFCKGDCQNYEEFTRADIGIKNKQTFVEDSLFANLQKEFAGIAQPFKLPAQEIPLYSRRNNVYRAR